MKDKITYLMKSEGLTTTQLAKILEIQTSAVSHLVAGRNKPGYDLLQKILRRFPRINPDWLLLDSGEPYRKDTENLTDEASDDALSVSHERDQIPFGLSGSSIEGGGDVDHDSGKNPIINLLSSNSKGAKSPIFVVLFYDDGSCESFSMRK